ncbi:15006_t:CDS:2 [Funneliformis geosporum]|uniref:12535_t:CDS:1 n=1 Tax=Funneliformis geosporum TaxID=1117311 RepID=A0A9W4SLE3_9GLOM|nr:12535_t:CDS:2 [Funneliformis geosporum]CAI2176338.1 15006_t:CDS:2 [Funneliformis geosporum]
MIVTPHFMKKAIKQLNLGSLSANLTFACEQDCRIGVAQAFVDSYALEIQPIFSDFSQKVTKNLYYNTSLSKITTDPSLVSSILKSIYTSTKDLVNKTLPQTVISESPRKIHDAIFETEPKFKGDCNHPKRVTQPPSGVAWTFDDCKNMDYICGNPPSVCHFFEDNRSRSIKAIVDDVKFHCSSGEFYDMIMNNIKTVATHDGLESDNVNYLLEQTGMTIKQYIDEFPATFQMKFCSNNTCNKYDHKIKELLLTFP